MLKLSRTTQLLTASTLHGAATLAAALDTGCFGPADRRVLVVCNNAAVPETAPALDAMPGFERLRGRFDDVISWNGTIAPFHPSGWSPRPDDVPLWERHLRLAWELGDDEVELAVESVEVSPALAIAEIFAGAPVDVYADGLMGYGPTRDKLDPLVGTRVRRLLHLDLVPGLKPLLLTEFGVEPLVVETEGYLKVLGELAAFPAELPSVEAPALLLGQCLSAPGLISAAQEEELHLRMVRGAVALGHTRLVFTPHPTAPARWSRSMEEEAERLGAELTVLDTGFPRTAVLAEVLYERMRPALVVGCFSTALLTASAFYGLPVARVGTELLLEGLSPYENVDRMPVTLVDALLPELGDRAAVEEQRPSDGAEREVGALVAAVGFAMRPRFHPGLRPAAERYLSTRLTPVTWRYFKRRRLTSLGLPGGVPARLSFLSRSAAVRRVVRRARSLRR
ncbi:polysialyltransferase family glycosyltransferase [Streptomyces sp. ME02-6991-2A]|uniref:polysialyltransferase family glycosyltransferase n=1 Tax=Streptomyces sp. ME02-6991-2A TaxID=3028677 RepID=UPI0029BA774D|nr:polysialyltransferase family glycosyltransferase [Streptomyces sp. ME02-6991-2A]MDX3377094.1 polysialyltransferase family glycosyltransferase [Streptomyces sp. ME02-6991-2A]